MAPLERRIDAIALAARMVNARMKVDNGRRESRPFAWLGFEFCVQRDFSIKQLRNGTPLFGRLCRTVEGVLGGSGDARAQIEMAALNGETVTFFIQCDGAGGVDCLGFEAFVL